MGLGYGLDARGVLVTVLISKNKSRPSTTGSPICGSVFTFESIQFSQLQYIPPHDSADEIL